MDGPQGLASRLTGGPHFGLYRSSFALMATTISNAALGMLFWVAAARLYPVEVVGAGAGGISALQLVATVGWVSLQFTLMRYVPIAGIRRVRLVLATYVVGVAAAVLAAGLFLAFFAEQSNVGFIASSPLGSAAFVVGAAFWVATSLQDPVLVGIGRALLVTVENVIFGLLKLGLLVAFVGTPEPWTFLGVWLAATVVVVVLITGVLVRHVPDGSASQLPPLGVLARFSTGHTGVALASWLPEFVVPLIMLGMLGPEANAHYFGAWTVAFAARTLVANMASALTVEAASRTDSFGRLARSSMRLAVWVLTPIIAVLVLGAEPILRLFGPSYVDAAPLLRLYALSIIPSAVVAYVVARDRDNHRFGDALIITASGSAVALLLDLVLIPVAGVTGAGIGWLLGQSLAAMIAVATTRPFRERRRAA